MRSKLSNGNKFDNFIHVFGIKVFPQKKLNKLVNE
jgi:hypothetical protein